MKQVKLEGPYITDKQINSKKDKNKKTRKKQFEEMKKFLGEVYIGQWYSIAGNKKQSKM